MVTVERWYVSVVELEEILQHEKFTFSVIKTQCSGKQKIVAIKKLAFSFFAFPLLW